MKQTHTSTRASAWSLVPTCALVVMSCSSGGAGEDPSTNPTTNLEWVLTHDNNSFKIGKWMHKQDDTIADWLENLYEEQGGCFEEATPGGDIALYEPINVVWLDYISENAQAARSRLRSFFTELGFGLSFFHSRDKSSLIDGQRIPQWPAAEAWSNAATTTMNDHARTFGPVQLPASGGFVYVTTGSISRESTLFSGHDYVSFDCSQGGLAPTNGFYMEGPLEDSGTSFSLESPGRFDGEEFHTGDHRGVRLFVADSPCVNSALLGTWDLVSVNGVMLPPTIFTLWDITEEELVITSELDCVEVASICVTPLRIQAMITEIHGTQCSSEVGETGEVRYALLANGMLRVLIEDSPGEVDDALFQRL